MEKSENMKLDRLSVAQMLQEHPIKNERKDTGSDTFGYWTMWFVSILQKMIGPMRL